MFGFFSRRDFQDARQQGVAHDVIDLHTVVTEQGGPCEGADLAILAERNAVRIGMASLEQLDCLGHFHAKRGAAGIQAQWRTAVQTKRLIELDLQGFDNCRVLFTCFDHASGIVHEVSPFQSWPGDA